MWLWAQLMNWVFPDNRFPELCSGKYFILTKAYFSDCIVSSVLIEACRRTFLHALPSHSKTYTQFLLTAYHFLTLTQPWKCGWLLSTYTGEIKRQSWQQPWDKRNGTLWNVPLLSCWGSARRTGARMKQGAGGSCDPPQIAADARASRGRRAWERTGNWEFFLVFFCRFL